MWYPARMLEVSLQTNVIWSTVVSYRNTSGQVLIQRIYTGDRCKSLAESQFLGLKCNITQHLQKGNTVSMKSYPVFILNKPMKRQCK